MTILDTGEGIAWLSENWQQLPGKTLLTISRARKLENNPSTADFRSILTAMGLSPDYLKPEHI